ncbi:hypothetical protein ALQ74_200125 [Pseudomonas savastanoi pv. glycinea]|uniref:TcfC Usher-like barrel domain-containing protein n=1 Tax=Pseudomonas savastanoi pv. glycinea TaxID=318 RepID=A0A3M3FI78_PSESG|nr:hypothetical protein ALQ74_200125 [Pseudomonas savastanoi pv. glycinea]
MSFSHRARMTASGRTDFQSAQANVRQSKQQPAQENYQVSHVSNWTDNGYRELGATLSTTNNNERGININGRVETDMGRLSGAVSHVANANRHKRHVLLIVCGNSSSVHLGHG